MVFGITDVVDDIKNSVANFGGEKETEDTKHGHNLKTLISTGWKEIKRDLNYSVVFLVGGTDKITFIALGSFGNIIL